MASITPTTVPSKRLSETISASATSFKLSDIKGWSGTDLTSADFGSKLYAVFRNSANTLMEIMQVDPTTITAASSAITITLRGLKFNGDLTTEVAGNKLIWVKGDTIVELGTHVPQLLKHFVTIVGSPAIQELIGYATQLAPLDNKDIPTKFYVDNLVSGGVVSNNRVVAAGNAGETISTGNLVYFDFTDNEWKKTDADTAASVNNVMLGIAQGAGTDGVSITGGVLLFGLDANQSGLTAGDIVYASNTAGGVVSGTPGTNERSVGMVAPGSTTSFYFDPYFLNSVTKNQKDALAGASGTPSSTNKFLTEASLTGFISPYAGRSAPSGWLMCDGSAVSRSTYANLFGVISPSTTFTVTIASPAVFSKTGHGLVTGDQIHITTTGALPTGLAVNTNYFVISTGLTADAFRVALSPEGTVVNTSGSQSGVHTYYVSSYGKGDGSTTFNVPDLRTRVPIGRGDSNPTTTISFEPAARSSNDITLPDKHFPVQGQKVQLTTTTTLPTGLSLVTDYWIIRNSNTSIAFATTQANANAGTKITLSDGGTGVHTIVHTNNAIAIVGRLAGEHDHGLSIGELPAHTHSLENVISTGGANPLSQAANTATNHTATGSTGSNTVANNMQPFIVLNYIIKT